MLDEILKEKEKKGDKKGALLLGATEASLLLGVSVATVRKWTFEKKLPVVRLGRRVLYDYDDLMRLINSGKEPAIRPLNGPGREAA